MSDMLQVTIPKSDQKNFDDFPNGINQTIKITKVVVKPGEQPVTIHYENDNGKPYKPCKSMCRVLVNVWGADSSKYAGKSLTIYGDPNVIFGGAKVGGIRISAMSDIKEPVTMALTTTRANRKPFTVQPLVVSTDPSFTDVLAEIATAPNVEALKLKHDHAVRTFKTDEQRKQIVEIKEKRKGELA